MYCCSEIIISLFIYALKAESQSDFTLFIVEKLRSQAAFAKGYMVVKLHNVRIVLFTILFLIFCHRLSEVEL